MRIGIVHCRRESCIMSVYIRVYNDVHFAAYDACDTCPIPRDITYHTREA